jgi:hypothetical protein
VETKKDYRVIKDFLPEKIMCDIEDVIRNNIFSWNITETTFTKEFDVLTAQDWSFSYTAKEKEMQEDPFFSALCFMLKAVLLIHGVEVERILRIRFGLTFPLLQSEIEISTPHVDSCEKHKAAILYLNTSDGDTILYENRHKWGIVFDNNTFPDYIKDMVFKEEIRITPERNKILLFEGNCFHSSAIPTETSRRLIINLNYI